ncbi:MAG: MATE family efflux transporter [Elusimicrobiota bacterium]|nr:MATE family efflux transporter [Elusimicrobiota bacterium]
MKALLSLAWPVIVSRSTQVVVGLADALMVAHLGEAAMAATTAGSLNAVAAFILPMGVVFIVSSFSSQLHGRGDHPGARRYGWYGLGVAALAQAVMLAGLPLLPRALGLLHYAPAVESAMTAYLSLRLLSTGFAVGIEALGNYFGGLGDTRMAMRANLAAMGLNVLFNWLLIDGNLGFPALGVRGAALASVAASLGAFLVLLAAFLLEGRTVASTPLRLDEFRRMLRFGFPLGLNWSFEFYAFIAFVNVVVASLGTAALGAMMAVIQINSVAFMPAFGLANAGSILVGQAIGAGRRDEVPALVRLTFLTAAGWMCLAGLVYLAFPALLLAPFASPDGDGTFLRVGVTMLMMSALWQAFDAGGITFTECLRAAGDTSFPMWTRCALAWGFFLPGSWLAVRRWGGDERHAMAFLLAYLGLLAVILYLRFRSGAWRRIELVPEATV